MTGIKRAGAVPEITNAFGFPFSYASQNATKKAFTGTGTTGVALDAQGCYILVASEDCYVKFGASNVAATSSSYHFWMPRGVPFVLHLPYTGDSDTIYYSVVQDTTAGNLHLTQMDSH